MLGRENSVVPTALSRSSTCYAPWVFMNLTLDQLVADLKRFIAPSYPETEVRAMPWDRDPTRTALYFTDPKCALIYPYQRWHYLTHLIPGRRMREHGGADC